MDENLPEDRPLTEEERRRNLEALLEEKDIEEYFDAPATVERVNDNGEIERVETSAARSSS